MILIEKIYRYSWSYDAHYRFFVYIIAAIN